MAFSLTKRGCWLKNFPSYAIITYLCIDKKRPVMRKLLTLVAILAMALPIWADDYDQLTFEKTTGSRTSIKSVGTVITFEGNTLTAVNGSEQATLAVDELLKMYFSASTAGLQGDANNDGEVNVADVMLTMNYLMGFTAENFSVGLADMDGDGNISVADVMAIAAMVMGN